MSMVGNSPTNERLLTDVNYVITQSLGTTASSSFWMDLGQAVSYPVIASVVFKFEQSPLTSSFNFITNSLTIQESETFASGNFTGVTELASFSTTGVGNTIAASNRKLMLPPDVKRYVRVQQAALSASAPLVNVTGSVTMSLLF